MYLTLFVRQKLALYDFTIIAFKRFKMKCLSKMRAPSWVLLWPFLTFATSILCRLFAPTMSPWVCVIREISVKLYEAGGSMMTEMHTLIYVEAYVCWSVIKGKTPFREPNQANPMIFREFLSQRIGFFFFEKKIFLNFL